MKGTKAKPNVSRSILESVGITNLFRNKSSGIYYARTNFDGKEIKRSPNTDDKDAAEAMLAETLVQLRKAVALNTEFQSDFVITARIEVHIERPQKSQTKA
jgi:hypothetical protein